MTKLSDEELAAEAARWIGSDRAPGWVYAPEAVPRQGESVSICIRLPKVMLDILREFARREGVGYQVLMKRWLDERIREEAKQAVVVHLQQPQFLEVSESLSFAPPPQIVLSCEQADPAMEVTGAAGIDRRRRKAKSV